MTGANHRPLSFWHDGLWAAGEPRAALMTQDSVDVAIVGAGYSGLWTAYYLKALDPGIRVAVVEAEVVGFGADICGGHGLCTGWFTRRAPRFGERPSD